MSCPMAGIGNGAGVERLPPSGRRISGRSGEAAREPVRDHGDAGGGVGIGGSVGAGGGVGLGGGVGAGDGDGIDVGDGGGVGVGLVGGGVGAGGSVGAGIAVGGGGGGGADGEPPADTAKADWAPLLIRGTLKPAATRY